EIFAAFERIKPRRVVLDSLSEISLLAQSSLRYLRQILALKHYFARQGATVLLLDDDGFRIRLVDAAAHTVGEFARRQFGGIELFDVDMKDQRILIR
ncbi:hypothetical protein AB9F41_33855, partial [Rhizobium leguminosarum]